MKQIKLEVCLIIKSHIKLFGNNVYWVAFHVMNLKILEKEIQRGV